MPIPEPPPLTCTEISGWSSRKRSAQAWAKLTIVSEPVILIAFSLWLEQLDRLAATSATSIATMAELTENLADMNGGLDFFRRANLRGRGRDSNSNYHWICVNHTGQLLAFCERRGGGAV